LIWQYAPTGQLAFWLLDGATVIDYVIPDAPVPGADWVIVGAGDSNHDGELDLFWQQQSTGALAVWLMRGAELDAGLMLSAPALPTGWHVVAVTDLDGDEYSDLIVQDSIGGLQVWYFADATRRFTASLHPSAPGAPGWVVVGPR